jgi:microcystin-dependent protein
MSSPFVGEIRCFGFPFAPYAWAFCNGQPVSIAQQETLYAVIGTIYGGDGQTTFNLPNLQGYVPMHWGNPASGFNTTIGQVQGAPYVTLTTAQEPTHTHTITVQAVASGGIVERTGTPGPNRWLADSFPDFLYANNNLSPMVQFSPKAISMVGGSQPHDNMQPYLALNFCISLYGVFPSRN